MMKWIFSGLVLLSVVFAVARGDAQSVSDAALSSCAQAVSLTITLSGAICLWSAIMRVAQKSGLSAALSKIMSPLLRKLFKGVAKGSLALEYISLNLTANLLGLGNASTPLGIAAMKELEKLDGENETASDNMILLVVLNTASLQLIPTTVAAIRLKNGSADPMEILPCVWVVSVICVVLTVTAAKILARVKRK